jgi:hypothetical protein
MGTMIRPQTSSVIVVALTAALAAQSPEPPLSDTRLTVHTLLREDVFAGTLRNDLTPFARAERNAVALLAERPDQRGNILSWQGGMSLYRAVRAHEAGEAAEFQRLYQQARTEFAEAGKATSGNEGVAAITGGSIATLADRLPADQRAAAWAVAYDAYMMLWKQQGPALEQLPVHMRGELLSGVALSAQRTGRQEEAAQFVDKMLTTLQGTPYEATAKQWKNDPSAAASSNVTCKSCHEPGRLGPTLSRLNK